MTWRVRYAGTGKTVEGLTTGEVIDGLRDGVWDADDFVRGFGDRDWATIEAHPQFADAAVLANPQPFVENEEEERLDMNPLIDVCLVLLVFFMIGVSYLNLPKGHRVPKNKPDNPGALRPVTDEQIKDLTIVVKASPGPDGKALVMVERDKVEPADLERKLLQYVKDTRKTEILIDAKGVDWGTVVKIIDAAAGAQIKNVHFRAGAAAK